MKRNSIRLIAMIAAFCVVFTSLPLLAGDLDASAMAKKKVATKITLKAKASGKHKVKLSWNKIKNPGKGYAVFRDGKCIKRLGKKKLSFTDTGLKAGTTYQYQIKVYKTKKLKQWLNKKTGKWQKKKPVAKYRGKKRTITKYTYKKPSRPVRIKTAAAPKPAADKSEPTTPETPTAQYTYDIKFLNEPYGNGGKTVVYVETNYPNLYKLGIDVIDSNGVKENGNNFTGLNAFSSMSEDFDDLHNITFNEEGKYFAVISPKSTGNCAIAVYEDRVQVASRSVYIKDYGSEEKAWRQSVIASATNNAMSNKEKMQAICSYILNNFKYYKTSHGAVVCLLADQGHPYWKDKHIDSSDTPAILVAFGNDLGYPLEDCFNKYPRGTAEWSLYHSKAYSKADDTYFDACPSSGSAEIGSVTMFNPSTAGLW